MRDWNGSGNSDNSVGLMRQSTPSVYCQMTVRAGRRVAAKSPMPAMELGAT
jgi:hypothetical protein